LKAGWIFEELHDFAEVCFDAFEASNVFEGYRFVGSFVAFGWASRKTRQKTAATKPPPPIIWLCERRIEITMNIIAPKVVAKNMKYHHADALFGGSIS